jgi:myosin-9
MESFKVRIFTGDIGAKQDYISVDAVKSTNSEEILKLAVQQLELGKWSNYQLVETFSAGGQICKERRLLGSENPVKIQLLWPRVVPQQHQDINRTEYHFFLRRKELNRKVGQWEECATPNPIDNFLSSFLQQPKNREYPDLCNLPDLNENTLLHNLRSRFEKGNIYTNIGSILISVNPFKFFPIYNPKYVRMYQNRRLGDVPPHIFAVADSAYHKMLADKHNQCIVISGESGSVKTECTNLLLHHLSALSQRGVYGTGIEQTILGAGPVLEVGHFLLRQTPCG